MAAQAVARLVAPDAERVADEEAHESERAVADVEADPEERVEEGRGPHDVEPVKDGDARHGRESEPLCVTRFRFGVQGNPFSCKEHCGGEAATAVVPTAR